MDADESRIISRSDDALWTSECTHSLLTGIVLTIIAVVFSDKMVPFYSFAFVFGTAAVFFFSVTFGSRYGVLQAFCVFTLMFWVHVVAGGEALGLFMGESVFLIFFFLCLALLPNIRPFVLTREIRELRQDCREYEKKLAELNSVYKQEHKQTVKEKSTESRQLAAKYSSRNTVLVTFARGMLQASSVREILNLLFYDLTKVFGAQQCAMLIRMQDSNELIVARIVHPEHQRLENNRCSADLPYFQQLFNQKALVSLPTSTPVTEDIEAEVLFPVLFEGEVYAAFTMSQPKAGTFSKHDRDFIATLAELTSNAIEQLKSSTTQR